MSELNDTAENPNLCIIDIGDLRIGMYVNRVCAQLGHVNLKSSGVVKSQQVVDHLVDKGVLSVEIDLSKGETGSEVAEPESVTKEGVVSTDEISNSEDHQDNLKEISLKDYPPVNFDSCQKLYGDAFLLQKQLRKDLENHNRVSSDAIKDVVDHLCHSLSLNSDAMVALTLLKNKQSFFLEQGINNAILAVSFATHLGLIEAEIQALGAAALLMDIGMTHIPDRIINKPTKLSVSDKLTVQQHVKMSIRLLERIEDLDVSGIRSLIYEHHERIDGSGYPNLLSGDQISKSGQILGLVDSYNAMTSERPYRRAMTPNSALSQLLKNNTCYSAELVQSFIRAMGIHPIGSLVKLKSGKLAIIIRQDTQSLTKPVVIAFYSVSAKHPIAAQRIDLAQNSDEIECAVHPKDYNLDHKQFLLEYLIPNVF